MCLCWFLSLPVLAGQTDPTEAAFGALLAMPASAPKNGTWEAFAVAAPTDFDAEAATQEDLIDYLDVQRKQGARFDSYRLQGTLFHHAVRARLQKVALWLLRNGANPRLRLNDNRSDELDGMGIAINVGAWRVFDALRKHPAYASLTKEELSKRYGQLVTASPEAVRALLDRKLWVANAPQVQAGLEVQLNTFLAQGRPSDALALWDAHTGFSPTSLACSELTAYKPDPPPAPAATPEQWRKAIERLPANLRGIGWLCAFRYASSQDHAQAMLAASGIDPWRDPLLAVQTGRLALVNRAWVGRLRTIPPANLSAALVSKDFQRFWLRGIATLPLADLQWALSLAKPVLTTTAVETAMGDWRHALSEFSKPQVTDTADRWRLLAQVAPPGNGYAAEPLIYAVPATLWAAWLAKGYAVSESSFRYWLANQASVVELRAAYPILQIHASGLARQALNWLVEPLSSPSAVGLWTANQFIKAELLESLGARVDKPYPLSAVYRGNTVEDASIAKAIAKKWVLDIPASQRPTVEVVKELGCQPVVSAAMRRSIADWGHWKPPPADPYGTPASLSDVVALPSANGEDCTWLATGGEQPGRKFIYELDFFEGVNRLTPCADGNTVYGIWSDSKSDWVKQKNIEVFGSLYRLRIKHSKKEALLELREGGGGCQPSSGVVYTVNSNAKTFELMVAERGNLVYDALVQQCDLSRLGSCLALDELQSTTLPLSWSAQYLPNERRAFLAALNRFDLAALDQAKAAGLFYDWLQTGLRQVGESSLSLEDKRKRAAWLLAQHVLLGGALDSETLALLLRWLPVQEWQPVMHVLKCERGDMKEFIKAANTAQRQDILKRAPTTCPVLAKK